jgi:hypothetical protein
MPDWSKGRLFQLKAAALCCKLTFIRFDYHILFPNVDRLFQCLNHPDTLRTSFPNLAQAGEDNSQDY